MIDLLVRLADKLWSPVSVALLLWEVVLYRVEEVMERIFADCLELWRMMVGFRM